MTMSLKTNNDAPLFEYLEEKRSEELAIKFTKNNISNLRKFYTVNILMVLSIILSICLMFYAQYRVDNLQNKVDLVQQEINDYKDEIKLLNVEWVYLTRPQRLRSLAKTYLKNNKNIAFNQVKNYDKLQEFYLANLKKYNANNYIEISQR